MTTVKKIVIRDNPEGASDKKRCIAEIYDEKDKIKKVKFGLYNSGGTYFDGATAEKRDNYNKRHGKMSEKWGKEGVRSAGFYSRWVLWESRSLAGIKKAVQEHSGVSSVSVKIKKLKEVKRPN